MGKLASLNFQKTFVCGHSFKFSPSIINHYWEHVDVLDDEMEVLEIDLMVSVITGG